MEDLAREKKLVEAVDEDLENPAVTKVLRDGAIIAATELVQLLGGGSENVRLAAARDILDRSGYKPVERKDVTSGGLPLAAPTLSDEQLMNAINGFLKRTSITAEAREVGDPQRDLPPGS